MLTEVDSAWAKNSVNTTVFRKNSLVSHKNIQYTAFYNEQQYVVLGKRKIGSKKWQLHTTQFRGNARDAHNIISIMVDGKGYLHLAWNHHNSPLNYSRGKEPGSLQMNNPVAMTGENEKKVTYPEFYRMPSGNILFIYRDGGSGNGNLVMNLYNTSTESWGRVQNNLLDGQGKRNAYWQAFVDAKGKIHISWVWRENPDVASNHDMCYAVSADGGINWHKSTGEKYQLPINAGNAEYVERIPQKTELINQTSMYAAPGGNVYIATYYRGVNELVPQYHIIALKNGKWQTYNAGFRSTPFTLSGGGTKSIPIARPQIIAWSNKNKKYIGLIFRDAERNNHVSIAILQEGSNQTKWVIKDIYKENTGAWEPSFDTELWKNKKQLHLFVLKTVQIDGEGNADIVPEPVKVLELKL